MKKKIKRIIQASVPVFCSLAFCMAAYAEEVDLSPIIDPLDILYMIVTATVSGVSGIVAVIFFVQMVSAFTSHDTTQQVNGIFKFGTALLIAFSPLVLEIVLGK